MASNAPSLKAVLFDRDGTLVVDVPYNGDPGGCSRTRVRGKSWIKCAAEDWPPAS